MIESIFFHPWVWIVPIVLVVLLAATAVGWWLAVRWDEIWGALAIMAGLGFLGLAAGFFAGMLPPYDASYYQTYQISGELTDIRQPLNEGSGTTGSMFVLAVEGIDYSIGTTDPRLRTYEVGDEVNLVCTKQFEYFVTPWYSCSVGG